MTQNKINQLETKIKKYAKAYYEGESLISDTEFDKLIDELKNIDPENKILSTPGWGYFPEPGVDKYRHLSMNIGSLDKIHIDDVDACVPIFAYDNDGDNEKTYIVMPKLDGNSVVCYYINGKLHQILSRGNGVIGVDITRNLYKNVPNKIENYGNFLIAIRGEAIITYEDFEGMDGANPRNKCAGLLQSKNAKREELQKIKFIPYSIVSISNINSDLKCMTKSDHFNFFKNNKFEEIPFQILEWNDLYGMHLNRNNIHNDLSTIDNKRLPVDGIVISRNKCIEYTFNIENWKNNENLFMYTLSSKQIAFKYPDISKETEVISINWKMSMGGKFIPVLKIKEIEIDGIKINNVTANNYKWLQEMECGIGARIKIRRANECIPNITETIDKSNNFQIPEKCNYCGRNVEYDKYETHLICPNQFCESKDIAIIYKVWEFIKPHGASDACFSLFLEKIRKTQIFYIMFDSTIITQFNRYLRNDDLWDKNPENFYHKLIKESLINFHNTKASIPQIIKMANIPSLGIRIGDRIFEDCQNSSKVFLGYVKTAFPEKIFKYEILNKYKYNLEKILYIWDGKIKQESTQKQTIKVAITGAVSMPRNKWFKEMEKFGVKKSSVSKDCDFLICEAESNSSSYKKAIEYQIPIVSESEFLEKTGINI